MKYLITVFALLTSSAGFATNYNFKQSQFSMTAVIKDTSTTPATIIPAFSLSGTALWIEDEANHELPRAQITLHRTTYDCTDVTYNYDDKYSCSIQGDKFQQILDEVVPHDVNFLAAQALIKKYYDNASYYDSFTIPLGILDQTDESVEHTELTDPDNDAISVDVELKTTGMHPL